MIHKCSSNIAYDSHSQVKGLDFKPKSQNKETVKNLCSDASTSRNISLSSYSKPESINVNSKTLTTRRSIKKRICNKSCMPDENSSNWNFHKAQTFFYERMKTRIPSKSIDAGYNHSNRDENVITPSFNSIKSRNNLDKLDFKSGTNFLSVLVQKASINANMDFLDSIAYGSTKTGTDSSNSPARKQLRPQVLPMFKLSSLFQYNQLTNHRAKPLESKKKKFNILDGFKIPKKSIFKTNKSHLHKDVRDAFKRQRQKTRYNINVHRNSYVRKDGLRKSNFTSFIRKNDTLCTKSTLDMNSDLTIPSLTNCVNQKRASVNDPMLSAIMHETFSRKYNKKSERACEKKEVKKIYFKPNFVSHQGFKYKQNSRVNALKKRIVYRMKEVEDLLNNS